MKVRILIIDDSPTARFALRHVIESEPDLEVVAEAAGGRDAMRAIAEHNPHLVTVDVHLEREDGIELAARIMEESPRPILIVTGVAAGAPELAFRALAAGALDVQPKLPGAWSREYAGERRRLIRTIKALARVPVVSRKRRDTLAHVPTRRSRPGGGLPRVILLGASTGGPAAIEQILVALPPPLPCPIVIGQHISHGFSDGLASWLSATARHPTLVCRSRTLLAPGTVYLAADDRHLVFVSPTELSPSDAAPREHQRPSIDMLFESAAEYVGCAALAVLLTGMGRDGAAGLLRLRSAGSRTFVQAPETCVVDGMPRAALELDAADQVLSLAEIASEVLAILADPSRPGQVGGAHGV